MSAAVRIGMVGCGRLAELGYLPALRRARGVRLAAVADVEVTRAVRVASLAGGVTHHPNAASLAAAGDVDALLVASPARAHVADARAAADGGLPTLIEKPPAPDLAGAKALAALRPAPRIGFNRRFDPGLDDLRAALAGVANPRLDLRLHYRRRSWRPHTVADDALLDLGPHLVDLATWLTAGHAVRVRVRHLEHTRARFEVELDRARASVDCATDRPHHERVAARDAGGRPLGGLRRGGLVAGIAARARPGRGREHPLVDSLTAQLEAFAVDVRDGAAGAGDRPGDHRLGTAAQAADVMAVVDRMRQAAGMPGEWLALATAAAHATPTAVAGT